MLRLHNLLLLLLHGMLAASVTAQLTFTTIPDQDEATLQERADAVSAYLASYLDAKCGVDASVTYNAVSDYQSAVDALLDGTADFGWYGGLTGVQAALRFPPSVYLAQRVEDTKFTSVFIQGPDVGLPADAGIQGADGKSLAFGSESSTSGHLMPQYFLSEADPPVVPASTIYTGSHDATVDAVADGSVEVGALNSVVWANRVASNTTGGTSVFYTTPEYLDYLWVGGTDLQEAWEVAVANASLAVGSLIEECRDINALLVEAFVAAKADEPLGEALLTAFSTVGYVSIEQNEYYPIEETGCKLGMIEEQYCASLPEDLGQGIPPAGDDMESDEVEKMEDDNTSGANGLLVLSPIYFGLAGIAAFGMI